MPKPSPETHAELLASFRAYLHLVITANQLGQQARLKGLPGPGMRAYGHALAKLPDNTLAAELVQPIWAMLGQIESAARGCHRALQDESLKDPAKRAALERLLEQLDYALALVMRRLPHQVTRRVETTQCGDLLSDAIYHFGIGDGVASARWIRRDMKLSPDQYSELEVTHHSASNYLFRFAWDVYRRIEVLDQLAEEFPEHIRAAARRMHGWPMLAHRHTNNRRHFNKLASKLELGADYPLDASEGARFRPDTPLVRYLDPLIRRIHIMCEELGDVQCRSADDERSMLLFVWWWLPEESPGEEELAALREARELPPLSKTTVNEWAEKVLVPLILATDACDWKNCKEPVLQRIAKQKGVKSRATFKSRLLAAVAATLRRLARPA